MVVISVPIRLRLAVSALLLVVPLIAIEVLIASRASWWNLPYRKMGTWAAIFALISVPLSVWISSGKKWAYALAVAISTIWVFLSAWAAIRLRYPPLGFFTIFLLFFGFLELLWLKSEMERSFFDPQMAWYQGLPKPIPGLQCKLLSGEKTLDLRVSRIDQDGVFVFSSSDGGKSPSPLLTFLEKKKLEMIFNFRDRQITCQGVPTLAIGKGTGAGIQFRWVSADLRKDIGDFVEILRGEGYV